MAALAGGTEKLKFGMNVVVVTFRDPLVLAKQCATIDFLSDGRLLPAFGVGGPSAPEWAATGRTTRKRGAIADEALQLMARLWTEDRVTFEGEHFQYKDAIIEPKPVQRPLPLWIGGASEAAIRRTARIGNGWLGACTPRRWPARSSPPSRSRPPQRVARSTTTTTAPASPSASAIGMSRSSRAPWTSTAGGRCLAAARLLRRR